MKFKRFGKLPGRPSALITLALKDLEKARKAKNVRIDMGIWYHRNENGCVVCLAGSVMRSTLKLKNSCRLFLYAPDNGFKEAAALKALNCFRMGDMWSGFHELGLSLRKGESFNRKIADYDSSNPTPFISDMTQLAADLKKAGY